MFDYNYKCLTTITNREDSRVYFIPRCFQRLSYTIDVSGGDVDVRGLYDQVSESRRREKKFKTQLLQSKAEVNSLRTTLDRLVQGGTAVSVCSSCCSG